MYRSPLHDSHSPEINYTPEISLSTLYSSGQSQSHHSFDQEPLSTSKPTIEHRVSRKPLPRSAKLQYEQVQSLPEAWQGFPEEKGYQWSPGLWTQIPIPGILAVLGSLICIAGTIAVLVRSDGVPVTHWTVSPTVYIALMTTGTNMLLRFAFHEGNKIAWWRKALQGGTVRDLHTRWESGDGFWGALGAGRNFNMVSLASIAATLIVIDQPLIQRASTIVPAEFNDLINVTASIAPEIPYGFTGFQYGRGAFQQVMTQPMIAAFNDYNTQTPMSTGFTGCSDTCTGFVDAGGLAAECTTVQGPIAYLQDPKTNQTNIVLDSALIPQSPFSVTFTLVQQRLMNASYISMMVRYTTAANKTNCGGTLIQRSCKLRSATLRYPITLNGTQVELGNITSRATIQAFQPADNHPASIDGGSDFNMWTLGGLYLAATSLFQSNATYKWDGAIGTIMTLPDTLSNQFLHTPVPRGNDTYMRLGIPQACASNWSDPTIHILSALNQIAFRVSMNAAQFPYRNSTTPPANQVLLMQQRRPINVFKSVYKYLAASTVLSVVCVALVLPTFMGWWHLGRSFSLNPIEIAKAFDAPLVNGPGSNAPLHELVKTMGSRRLNYGEVEVSGSQPSKRELKFAEPQSTVRPTLGTVYD